ncbi:AAA domain-containing protein [Shewanella atlantica]|uniref:Nuclease n=1 Tax=Shewanella atlantica TaxID=271099 RepID=A0A431WCM7_9GAMM|nr:AAA domain-containing protein [Shewanella atlantica]RTR33201.1 nuclease [Shewanella atlantica]
MEVKYWEGGLTLHEIDAIEKMSEVFGVKKVEQKSAVGSKPIKFGSFEQLKQLKPETSSLWPWKGYAGFRLIGGRNNEGEFDLIIVTHFSVIIIELKHWNGELTANGDQWYQNGEHRGRSAVSITQDKQYMLREKLRSSGRKFPSFEGNKFNSPRVDFFVVLTGTANGSKLPEKDRKHVLNLNEFLALADEKIFEEMFLPPNVPKRALNLRLNEDFDVFDSIFNDGQTKPKSLLVNGYEAEEKIYPPEGVESVYTEFQAKSKQRKDDKALLRRWDFSKFNDRELKTTEGRYKVVSHEKEVLTHIRQYDDELYKSCLTSLTNIDPSQITQEFYELYELPYGHSRFNDYVADHADKLNDEQRLSLVKVLLHHFSSLHGINIAHRDIGDHSLWLSPGNKVALSSFMSSYHQPAGTVGPRRKAISTGVISPPEDRSESLDHRATEYHRDVYALGVLCFLLLSGKRLSIKSVEAALQGIAENAEWYGDVLRKAVSDIPSERFNNADAMQAALIGAQPAQEAIELFDDSLLDKYRKKINLYKVYCEDEEISSDELKEIYRSDDQLVKIWNNVNAGNDQAGVYQCMNFFDQIERIGAVSPAYLSTIRDYGITHKSELFLVQDYIDGESWDDWSKKDHPIDTCLAAIQALIRNIEHLEGIGLSHGDLHPGNLLVQEYGDDLRVVLIDIPDFTGSSETARNHRYSPEYIESATTSERDNFAVMRISAELLALDWDNLQAETEYSVVAESLKEETSDSNGFLSLDRFKAALVEQFDPVDDSISKVSVSLNRRDFEEAVTILPDNGELYVYIEKSRQKDNSVKVSFYGVNAFLDVFFNTEGVLIENALVPRAIDGVPGWVKSKSQLVLNLSIEILTGYNDLSALDNHLLEQDTFLPDCKNIANPIEDDKDIHEIKKLMEQVASPAPQDVDASTDNFISSGLDSIPRSIDEKLTTRNIWKAIIEAETEALPSIEVGDDPQPDLKRNELIIPYDSDSEILDSFNRDDEVFAIKKVGDREFNLGKIILEKSTSSEVRLPLTNKKGPELGDILYLRTKKDRASYTRRKKAMERVLNQSSVVPDMVSYFDPLQDMKPVHFHDGPTDDQLSRYDREDKDKKISLNEAQRSAFRMLFSKGPLSLLQGPPGTGKTEFIAAFVHYLLEQDHASHILLVSQSHEAVNTAVDRIRSHCVRFETPIDIVRFSNRESSVSDGLKDVYSRNIIESTRQSFIAELKERILHLQPALRLDSDYLEALLGVEFGIKKKIKNLIRLQSDAKDGEDESYVKSVTQTIASLESQLKNELTEQYDILSFDLSNVADKVDEKINQLYGIGPHEYRRVKALIQIIDDYKERLATNPGSYEEFLARSRTLVCGTCVGMGLGHLGINTVQYDWVIIDEAARSISSELAIAMQSAKRVLLVGDHKQLPPLYQDEHKNVILRNLGVPKVEPALSHVFMSDFEKAFESSYGQHVGSSLLTQYRMAEPIGNLVSHTFYDKKLQTGERNIPDFYRNGPEALRSTVTWLDTSSRGKKSYDRQDGTSLINPEEVDQIIHILKEVEQDFDYCQKLSDLVKEGEPPIGVICMYAAQKRVLRKKFNESNWSDGFKSLVKIDTVDSYQGKENRVVIVSITRNAEDRKPRFLKQPNRINVAMSRSMDRLIVVGSISMWNKENAELPLGKVASFIQERQGEDYRILKARDVSNRRAAK